MDRQAVVMNGQLDVMRAQQRARIGVFVAFTKILDSSSRALIGVQVLPTWHNSGTTPATRAFTGVNIQSDVPSGFDYGDLAAVEHREIVIGPSEDSPFSLKLPITQIEMINAGHPITVWGWITYHDVFKDTPVHLTEFCREIMSTSSGPLNAKNVVPDINFSSTLCRTHNCYDEDCPDYQKHVK